MLAEFRPLFPHLRPLRGKFLCGLFASVIYGLASGAGLPLLSETALPVIFQDSERLKEVSPWFLNLVEQLFGGDRQRLIIASCLFIPVVFLVRSLGGYLGSYWMNEVGMRGIEGFRKEIFGRLLALPMNFFSQRASGDLVSRVVSDTGLLQTSVTKAAGDIVKQPVTLIAVIGFLVMKAIQNEGVFFALIGGISIPLLVFPIRILGKRLKKRGALLQEKTGEITGMTSEVIQNPLEVRAYNLQGRFSSVFNDLANQWCRIQLKLVRYTQLMSPLVEIVAAIGFAFSLYLGAQKGMQLEEFLGMATALFMAYEPIKKLGSLYGTLEQAKAAMARVGVILEAEDEIPEPEHPVTVTRAKGELSFRKVSFSYGDQEILKDVNVTISEGQTIALVGESGGGKTTFANLIPRFYEASQGCIMIDGIDVKDYRKSDLRAQIAIVPQMPVLFRGTIRENILMGQPEASPAEVEEAARKAYAHDFILKQEEGYETLVSEKGSTLSGGQRQRIAIARAFLKNAPILILDEATSALDKDSEEKVREALAKLSRNRTTLMITHRESSMASAQAILSFDKGIVTKL